MELLTCHFLLKIKNAPTAIAAKPMAIMTGMIEPYSNVASLNLVFLITTCEFSLTVKFTTGVIIS